MTSIIFIISFLVGIVSGYFLRILIAKRSLQSLETKISQKLKEAQQKADEILKNELEGE